MVDALRFSRPTSYLDILHSKQRRAHQNLHGGEVKLDNERPSDLDLPLDHTASPRQRQRPWSLRPPKEVMQPRAWSESHAQEFDGRNEPRCAAGSAAPSIRIARGASTGSNEFEDGSQATKPKKSVDFGSFEYRSSLARGASSGKAVWVCARVNPQSARQRRHSSAPPGRPAPSAVVTAACAGRAVPRREAVGRDEERPTHAIETRSGGASSSLHPSTVAASSASVPTPIVCTVDTGTQTVGGPTSGRPRSAACKVRHDAEKSALLEELSRTDRSWREMVSLLETQLSEARSQVGKLEGLSRTQLRRIRQLEESAREQEERYESLKERQRRWQQQGTLALTVGGGGEGGGGEGGGGEGGGGEGGSGEGSGEGGETSQSVDYL